MKARNRAGRFFVHILTLLYVYFELSTLVNGKIFPSIPWSFLNPRFKEGTFRLNVMPYSKVTIICPNKHTILVTADSEPTDNELYENMWLVDSLSYHSCNVSNSTGNMKLHNCDQPSKLSWLQLVFRPFSPSGPGFKPGGTYYYISTSNGQKNSLDQKSKGHCETDNMKMEIYVCKDSEDEHCAEDKSTTLTTTGTAIDGRLLLTTPTSGVSPVRNSERLPSSTPSALEISINQHAPETSTQGNQTNTSSPQGPPNVREFKGVQPRSTSVTMWVVIIGLLGALFAVSVVVNFYFYKKIKVKSELKKPDYNRETASGLL